MPTTAQAVDALETWIEVYDNAVLNGEERPKAVELADEVVRVAGPQPSKAVITSLSDVLKDFYVGPIYEPGFVPEYDPYTDTYLLRDGRRISRQEFERRFLPPATLAQYTAKH